ncbi:cupredoxin domain-containing protein [Brevundimonas diminuta]|uniref:cupredoxin domain-containing protein n=1 Tax=Brevundimonas diminuta TaxID=293 RepID=UPI0032080AA7
MSVDQGKGERSRRDVLASAAILTLAAAWPARAAGRRHVVVIDKMAFGAPPSGVKVGDTITWTNRDIVRHTATARNGAFNLDLPPGASASAVMSRAGAVPYYCRYHPAMRGEISVGV